MTKILLVEDHEELWDALSRRLKRAGFDVLLATDGRQGIERARAERPDIILLDLNLPVLDGWTVARLLGAETTTERIPVIALTAQSIARSEHDESPTAVFDGYHPKPVDFPRLLAQIEEILLAREEEDPPR